MSQRTTYTLRHLQDQKMATVSTQSAVGAPLRAAAIARQLLGLVESGYFERRPQEEEQIRLRGLLVQLPNLIG